MKFSKGLIVILIVLSSLYLYVETKNISKIKKERKFNAEKRFKANSKSKAQYYFDIADASQEVLKETDTIADQLTDHGNHQINFVSDAEKYYEEDPDWMIKTLYSQLKSKYTDYTFNVGSDLTIKIAMVINRKLLGTDSIVHEMLGVCAKGTTGKAHYFLMDRLALYIVYTKIRVVFLGFDNDCNETSDRWPHIRSPKLLVLKDKPANLPSVTRPSLIKLLRAMMYYATSYKTYGLDGWNCQHFATGFFNTIYAGVNSRTTNTNNYFAGCWNGLVGCNRYDFSDFPPYTSKKRSVKRKRFSKRKSK